MLIWGYLMKFSLGLKPFKDYWLNCNFNTIFSVLTSSEPTYKLAAYLNDYSYEIDELNTPSNTKFNCLILKPMLKFREEHLSYLFSPPRPLNFKYNKGYIDFLKDLIRKEELVTIGVDLFYWIPNSICWNRHHWEHYSLINGFDDERKVFYVLDENNSGYNEFEVPEERLLTAVQNSPLEPHGHVQGKINHIEQFKLDIKDVIYNAVRLKEELKTIKYGTLWQLSDQDFDEGHMSDLISMYIFQVANRHLANQLLLKALHKEIQNNEIINSLIQYSQDLQDGWVLVKNKMVKLYFTKDRKPFIEDINLKCKSLFNKEYEMWDTFLYCVTK